MDDGLTFRFVLSDEGSSGGAPPQPPSEALPGAASRSRPTQPDEAPPAPRQPPPEAAAPAPRSAPQPGSSAPEAAKKESPVDRADDRPRRRRSPSPAENSPEPSPRKPPATKEETKKPGEAAKLLGELVHHLQQVPGIGRAIGSLYHVVEPLVDARKKIQQIRATEAKRRESSVTAPAATVPQPRPVAPTTTLAPTPQPQPPGGFRIAGDPNQQSAIQKLVAALGPLPEGNRELRETLKPLAALGYTMGELLAAVKSMRRETEERTPGVEGARPAEKAEAPQPQSQPAESGTPQRRPAQPADKIDLTDRDKPAPRPVPTTPPEATPAPGGASAAAGEASEAAPAAGAAAEAAEGTAIAGGAALGPPGLIVAVAAVATIGAATRAFGALIKTTKALDQSFSDTAHRLAAYSGAIAAAEANAYARRVVNDVQRADRLGGRLGQFTNQRADMSRSLDNIFDALRGAALNEVVPIMKIINKILQPIAEHSEDIETALTGAIDILSLGMVPLMKKIAELLADDEDDQALNPLADIMGIFEHARSGKPLRDFDPRGALGGLGSIDNPLTPPGLGI